MKCERNGDGYQLVSIKQVGNDDKDDNGLTAGAIAAIVIACLLLLQQ